MKTIKKITEEINKKVPDLSEKIADSVDWNAVKESCDDVKKRNAAIKTAERNAKRKNNGKSTILDWLARNKKVIITFVDDTDNGKTLKTVTKTGPTNSSVDYTTGDDINT